MIGTTPGVIKVPKGAVFIRVKKQVVWVPINGENALVLLKIRSIA